MPRLLIHKEGENAAIESPEMGPLACEHQRERVESVISIAHREGGVEQARDVVCDLGWVQVAAHVVTGVEIVDEPTEGTV